MCPVKISPPGVVVRRAGATARSIVENETDYIDSIYFLQIFDHPVLQLCGRRCALVWRSKSHCPSWRLYQVSYSSSKPNKCGMNLFMTLSHMFRTISSYKEFYIDSSSDMT